VVWALARARPLVVVTRVKTPVGVAGFALALRVVKHPSIVASQSVASPTHRTTGAGYFLVLWMKQQVQGRVANAQPRPSPAIPGLESIGQKQGHHHELALLGRHRHKLQGGGQTPGQCKCRVRDCGINLVCLQSYRAGNSSTKSTLK